MLVITTFRIRTKITAAESRLARAILRYSIRLEHLDGATAAAAGAGRCHVHPPAGSVTQKPSQSRRRKKEIPSERKRVEAQSVSQTTQRAGGLLRPLYLCAVGH